MLGKLLHRGVVRSRRTNFARICRGKASPSDGRGGRRFGHQSEANLTTAGEFHIDLRKQLRVEQCAMLDPMAAVDPESHAQGVKAMLGAGMPGPGKRQRVTHPSQADEWMTAPLEFVIQESKVEARVVRH